MSAGFKVTDDDGFHCIGGDAQVTLMQIATLGYMQLVCQSGGWFRFTLLGHYESILGEGGYKTIEFYVMMLERSLTAMRGKNTLGVQENWAVKQTKFVLQNRYTLAEVKA